MYDVIIPAKIPSKYMHDIEIHFKVKYIMYSPNSYQFISQVVVGRVHNVLDFEVNLNIMHVF